MYTNNTRKDVIIEFNQMGFGFLHARRQDGRYAIVIDFNDLILWWYWYKLDEIVEMRSPILIDITNQIVIFVEIYGSKA